MWTCPNCQRKFRAENQKHSCGENTVDQFLQGKAPHMVELYHYFIDTYTAMGSIAVNATKSALVISSEKQFAYIINIGKSFIDIVVHFSEPFHDTLCFHKVAQVPGTLQFNHHFRLYERADITPELKSYMELSYKNSLQK